MPSSRGFTFIELILVLGLVGILAAFSMVMSMSTLSRSRVLETRDLFVTHLLQNARSEALANIDARSHGVYIDNRCHRFIRFADTTYTPPSDCAHDPEEIPYSTDRISVTNTGGDIIIFEQLSGNVITGAGTVTLTNGAETLDITLRTSGQIDW